jgi:hypothetical protein
MQGVFLIYYSKRIVNRRRMFEIWDGVCYRAYATRVFDFARHRNHTSLRLKMMRCIICLVHIK